MKAHNSKAVNGLARVLVAGRDGQIKCDAVNCLQDMALVVDCIPSSPQIPDHWDEEHAALVVVVASGPRLEYLELCRMLRAKVNAPLVVMGHGNEEEVVQLLEAGIDDYIVWPSPTKWICAKLEAVLRRSRRHQVRHAVTRCGEISVNFLRRQVTVGGTNVALTPIEFRLLSCLLQNVGRVMSPCALIKEVHGFDCGNREAQEMAKVYIRRLRRKIEPDAHQPRYVLNVRGFGYVLENRPGPRNERMVGTGRFSQRDGPLNNRALSDKIMAATASPDC